MIYLDNAATTKVDERVFKSMRQWFLEDYGNPSSVHDPGLKAHKKIQESRKIIADKINAKSSEIIFTSGGTESNNLALKGLFLANPNKKHIVTTKIEHDSVLEVCKELENVGIKVTYLGVDSEGFIDLKELEKSIRKDTLVVSVIHGNNEIGTLQDLEKIGKICKSKNVLFHADACQSFCKEKINIERMNLDLATLNSHKIHGPKGVGALFVKKGTKINSIINGGGQESGLRSGTLNVPGIIGFAEAVKISNEKENLDIKKLRNYFIEKLFNIKGTKLNGPLEKRLCNNISVSFGFDGETLVDYLNAREVFCSTGSACSNHKDESSHVLEGIGLTKKQIKGTLRFSLSKFNTKKEIDKTTSEIKKILDKFEK